MKTMILAVCLILSACATDPPTEKFVPEIPPAELVSSPMPLLEIVASSDGTIDVKGALSKAITNNIAAKHNFDQLQKLEDWLKKTQENVQKANEKH